MSDEHLAKLLSSPLALLLDEWPAPGFDSFDEAAAFIAQVSNATLNEIERLTEVDSWDDQAAKRVLQGAIRHLHIK